MASEKRWVRATCGESIIVGYAVWDVHGHMSVMIHGGHATQVTLDTTHWQVEELGTSSSRRYEVAGMTCRWIDPPCREA